MTQVVSKQRIISQFISPGSLSPPERRSTLFLQSGAVLSTSTTLPAPDNSLLAPTLTPKTQ